MSETVVATDADKALDLLDLVEWLSAQTWSDFAVSLADYFDRKGYLSEKQEKAARSMRAKCEAKAAVKASAVKGTAITEAGIFVKEGEIFKVQKSQTSGKLYAKRLVKDTSSVWEYVGGVHKNGLVAEMKMTADDAAAFGKLYGVCVRCSKTLTDERSIEVGYGATCAAHMGWPWG